MFLSLKNKSRHSSFPGQMNHHIDKLVSSGLSVGQATKLISQINKICDQLYTQIQTQNTLSSQWSSIDYPELTSTVSSIRNLFIPPGSSLNHSGNTSSPLQSIDKYQLDQIERSLKDDFVALKSAVQLDISLESRRNTYNTQEIQRICRECIAYASLQSQESKKKLESVERSATSAICAFAGLLGCSFVGYCFFFKEY